MSRLLPSIGMVGTWVTNDPVDLVVLSDVIYTCRAIRSISDYLAQDIDPLAKVYQPLGLTEAQYRQDYQDNVYIVSLQAANESWIHVPITFIEKFPNGTGSIYRKNSLVVSLPGLPVDQDYSLITAKLIEAVNNILGTESAVTLVNTGIDYLVPPDDHTVNLALREANKSTFSSKHAQVRALQHENQRLQDLLNQLAICLNGYCRTGQGITLPTFNPDTPGHTRKIDAADILYDDRRMPDNAIDLFLYGERRAVRNRSARANPPVETRGPLFSPAPTPTDLGELPGTNIPTAINEVYPVSSADHFLYSETLDKEETSIQIFNPDRRSYKLIMDSFAETSMNMILLSNYAVSNRGNTASELYLKEGVRIIR